MRITGLTHSDFTGDLSGRHPSVMEEGRRKFKTTAVNKWLMEQIHYSNQYRDELLTALRENKKRKAHEKKDKKKKKRKKHSHS